jgi:hypothetical protein
VEDRAAALLDRVAEGTGGAAAAFALRAGEAVVRVVAEVLAMRSWRSLSMAGDFVVTAMPSSTATAQEVRMPAVPAISTTQRLQPLSPPPRWQEGGRSGWAHSEGM